jgi:MFS family permease
MGTEHREDGRSAVLEGVQSAVSGAPRRRAGWRRTFTALSERDYAVYFYGNMAFFLAMQMNLILRGWLAFDLTESAAAVGYVSVGAALPMLIVAPIGGLLADLVNKRTLLMAAQSTLVVVNFAVAVLIIGGTIEFWQLLLSAIASGAVFAVVMPARQALVAQLIPQHMMMNAVALQMGGVNLTRIAGPAVAGLLIAPIGSGWVYMITVALFAVAAVSMLMLPSHGMTAERRREPFVSNLVGGVRYVAKTPLFRVLLATALIMPLFAIPVQQMLPVFAEDVYGLGPGALGILMASAGVGGLIGALISANLDDVEHKGRIMLVGGLMMGVCYFAFAITPMFVPALLLLAAGNTGNMLFMATNNSVIQTRVPDAVRGRVMALLMMSFGTMPLGVLPVAIASDAIGVPAAIAISSGIMLAVIVAFFALSPVLRNLRLSGLDRSELSPVEAARRVADGSITAEEARRLTGRIEM